MSKFLKITLIILSILLIAINISFVQATEESDVESRPVSFVDDYPQNTIAEDEIKNVVGSTLDTISSTVTKVSTVNSYDQANLQLNNILSIILISIGVLLILFAIAILIRLKK